MESLEENFSFLARSRNIVNQRPTRITTFYYYYFSSLCPFYENRARINRGAKVSAVPHRFPDKKREKRKTRLRELFRLSRSGRLIASGGRKRQTVTSV